MYRINKKFIFVASKHPCGSAGKESACNVGDLGLISGLGRSPATHSSILAWRIPWTEEPGTDEETVETLSDFIIGGSKITADGDCSHEIKDAYSLEEKL